MTLGLKEFLRAAGLQHHYARFTSMGVHHVAHLSGMTMEDYPILGIHSMKERTQLFHLVQMVKSLDFASLGCEDGDDYGADNGDKYYAVLDSSTYDDGYDYEDEEHGAINKSNASPSSVCRRLDFSCETLDHFMKLRSDSTRNEQQVQRKGSITHTRPGLDIGSTVAFGYNGNHKDRTAAPGRPSNCHMGRNTKSDIIRGTTMGNTHARLSPKLVSSHKQKPRPATVTPKRFEKKPGGHKDRRKISMKERLNTNMGCKGGCGCRAMPTPVYESKRTTGYNYGLPQSSLPPSRKREEGGQRISVCVRKRPLTRVESQRGETDVVTCLDGECVIVHEGKEAVDLTQYILQHRFYFDKVFGEESSNEEVYQRTAYPLVQHMLSGLFAREDGQKVVHIAGLRDVRVDSVSSLLEVISQGTEVRTQGVSGVNPLSSRSHALLQIQLRDPNQQIAGRMWFVDLAGSERASDTKEPDRQSRMVGAEINQSLLALKECIRSLDQAQLHTPFRQSKLTQVLKDSFVGDSMTCMIANISPGDLATEHTLNTLRYADRVKELRGQGELKGGRRGKVLSSPKHNLSKSNSSSGSSVGAKRKSPRKKQKLARQKETLSPITPNTRLPKGSAVLCSTPNNIRWEEKTNIKHRKEIGLKDLSKLREWLEISDKGHGREGAGERKEKEKGGRRENEMFGRSNSHSVSDQNARLGLVLGQPTDHPIHLQKTLIQKQPDMYHGEKKNQHCGVTGWREVQRRQIKQQRQEENSRNKCEVQSVKDRDFKKVGESDMERQRHLRQYHQQLQQFMPSSACSSVSFSSPSTCPPVYSSSQAPLSFSVSPSSSSSLRHSSHFLGSALIGLEGVLDAYKAEVNVTTEGRGRLPFPSCDILFHNKNNDEAAHGASGGVGEDWMVSWPGKDSGESGRRRSREGKACCSPAGMEGDERRSAWVTTIGTAQADRMTGAMPTKVAQVSYSCHSEDRSKMGEDDLDSSDVQPGMWSTEEEEGAYYNIMSTPNNSNNLLNYPPFESHSWQAPAEQPLSPACEHIDALLMPNDLSDLACDSVRPRCTSNLLPLSSQNTTFLHSQPATQVLSTSITQTENIMVTGALNKLPEDPVCLQIHSHPEVKAKIQSSPQDETCSDSLSYTIDPLSISMLEVDQQVATESFLQGAQNTTSLCVLKNKKGRSSRVEETEQNKCAGMAGEIVEDVEFALLELPQPNTNCPPNSKTMAAVNHTEQAKGQYCATCEHHGISMTKPTVPEVMLLSLQDQESTETPHTMPALRTKACASQLKPKCASGTFDMAPGSALFQCSGKTELSNSISSCATQTPRALGQFRTVHSSAPNNSPQPNSPVESNGQERTSNHLNRPIIPLSAFEDLDHTKWCIVQAHWAQLEEMEALFHKEGTLLCQQPDMAFGEYVHKLDEIMERKAKSVHSMRAQLQPYLKSSDLNP
ncbi:uncharacterized protein LOC115048539 isoform X2 [Echeneis naucrates]|uniref:uncharacterized protein LOC115048539 isoform X2 n=1 Tax=Echeneis naucrates TaxID=173247 RepID=UPI001114114D|nr:uncharacterized protein LOC115048539 isoform X2 [Echeneis naucrates]